MRVPFTPAEDAAIRAGYRRGAIAALAARLGRTAGSVHQRAARLGVRVRHDRPKKGPEFEARVLALHARDRNASEIARELGCAVVTVRGALARHGRVSLGRSSPAARERCRSRMRERTAAGDVMVLARWRDRSPATAYGLPPLSGQALRVLLALLNGPLTKRELCAALGLPWKGPKRSLRTHHGMTHTHNLKHKGLVVCVCRGLGPGAGKAAGKEYRYSLTPRALELLTAGKGGGA